MAVDTNVSTVDNAYSVGNMNNLKVWSRVIDFSVNNLASGAWFEIMGLPAGALVVQGILEVLTVDAGGGTVALGYGGGHELLGATAVSSLTTTAMEHSAVAWHSHDDVSIAAGSASLTTAKVRVTLLVLDQDAMSSSAAN